MFVRRIPILCKCWIVRFRCDRRAAALRCCVLANGAAIDRARRREQRPPRIQIGTRARVVVLSRRNTEVEGARVVSWDGRSAEDWTRELESCDALINLAGRSVNCRYHSGNRRLMMESRVASTRVLGQALQGCARPPRVWFNLSTATLYKHTYDDPHDENGVIESTPEARDAFSIEVAQAWEKEFENADAPRTRKIALRAAMVFGNEPGGVYDPLRRLTRWGLGGKMSRGRQYVSWIHAEDFRRALDWLVERQTARGVYNICSPHPLTNAEMMKTLRSILGRSVGLPAAGWMLEIGAWVLRTETELLIKSRRVVPARLLAEGFTFHHPTLAQALADLERARSGADAVRGRKRRAVDIEKKPSTTTTR